MKNKFKKSKIIVPALALITATTVASVTGTVAWFSANRVATATANFSATDSEGNLLLKTVAGVGTTVESTVDYATTNAVTVDGVLTHGSYNAAANGATTGNLYVANISEGTTGSYQIDGYTSKGTISGNTGDTISASSLPWCAGKTSGTDNKKIWYAVSWTVSIKLASEGNTSTTKMVFVDFSKTTFSDKADVNQGFRVALMDTAHTYIIGADNQKNHVTGTSTSNVENWSTYHQFGESYTKVQDNASKTAVETETNGFLFELNGTEAKELTVVAWYEGEDTNVVSSSTNNFNPSDLSLNFYCRQTLTA